VKRGEIWAVGTGAGYAGKPRPAVIIQDDRFDLESFTLCLFTSEPPATSLFRLVVHPDSVNGLRIRCYLVVDKITTVPKSKIGKRIGRLSDRDMVGLNSALLVFLGIASPARHG
jgi:mRNA interferase MazF